MANKQRDDVNRQLLTAAEEARSVLFPIMLAEKAHRLRGPFTEAVKLLDEAIGAARKEMQDAKDRGS
jgi:hypothetical protein